MSSKKNNLDEELSDVSSEEENIVNFAKKNKKEKKEKKPQKKKEDSESEESEQKNEKLLSKKTKREDKKKQKEESDSDSDSDSKKKKSKNNKKPKKAAHDSDDEDNEDSENEKKQKKIKNGKNKKEESSSDEEENEEEDKRKKESKEKNKNKKLKNNNNVKEDSDSDESESEKKEKLKNKKEESEGDEDEESENKNNSKNKKVSTLEESESESEDKEKNKKKQKNKEENSDEKENEDDDNEPKLVKNESKEEEKKEKEKKSYNSGTWPELFVNNLSYKTTDESLKNYFSKYGEVELTKIVYDKETGRPKGVGFCKFCDPDSAAKALADNDNLFLDGRPIAVSYSNDKKGSAKVKKSNFKGDRNYQGEKYSIFIGNLSFKTNEDGIKNLFEDCGNIIDIRIAKTPEGRLRGFAHVDFDSNEAVESAIEKSGYKLDGRELRIDRTTNKPSTNKGVFGENSYKKFKNKKNEEVSDIDKAKKTGKIINTGSKSQKIVNSDDDDDDEE